MSFEPSILLKKEDLQKHESSLIKEEYSDDEMKSRVAKYLLGLLDSEVIEFEGLNLLIDQPELSVFNKAVRDKLFDLDIYFKEFL